MDDGARALVIVGRPGMFSAGFNLNEMTSSSASMRKLVVRGGRWMLDLYGLGLPTVAACTGHALAMGSLLLLAHHVDARFGAVRVDLVAVRPRPTLTILTDGAGGGRVVTSPALPPRFGEDVLLFPAPDLDHFVDATSETAILRLFPVALLVERTRPAGLCGNAILSVNDR